MRRTPAWRSVRSVSSSGARSCATMSAPVMFRRELLWNMTIPNKRLRALKGYLYWFLSRITHKTWSVRYQIRSVPVINVRAQFGVKGLEKPFLSIIAPVLKYRYKLLPNRNQFIGRKCTCGRRVVITEWSIKLTQCVDNVMVSLDTATSSMVLLEAPEGLLSRRCDTLNWSAFQTRGSWCNLGRLLRW